uniref:TAFA chemokine like family member 5 n=1 Tax=Pan troglodytes TaxID=9598 RepID=A0A2I3S1W0_PANTR
MQLLKALWALAGAALCCFLVLVIHAQFLKEGQLAAGTCEIVTLDRDSSQPRRTIARQTARCACRKGQIAGTTRARPACVDARIIKTKQWCDMLPCLEGEGCDLLINRSGWTCTQPGGRIKTTTVRGPRLSRGCAGEGVCVCGPPTPPGLRGDRWQLLTPSSCREARALSPPPPPSLGLNS